MKQFQDFSRKNNVEFNDLDFQSKVVTGDFDDIPDGSILIPDLNIIGALWDTEKESLADLDLTSPTINKYIIIIRI